MVFFMLGLSLHPSIAAPTTDTAHFTGEFTFFEMDTNTSDLWESEATFFPVVSNTGRYVFAHANHEIIPGFHGTSDGLYERTFYFWDRDKIETNLSPEPTQILKFSQSYQGPWVRFSPDDQFVALKSEGELQILHLPSLEIELSIAVRDRAESFSWYRSPDRPGHLAWSADSTRLAALSDMLVDYQSMDVLTVWDKRSDELRRVPLSPPPEGHPRVITALEDVWFIRQIGGRSFEFCPIDLQERNNYCPYFPLPPEDEWLFALPSGLVAMPWAGPLDCRERRGPVLISWLEGTGYYGAGIPSDISDSQYDPIRFAYTSPILREMPVPGNFTFSPDGHYFFYPGCGAHRGIWDFENNRPVQKLPRNIEPVWLPDSRHFLSFNRFSKVLTLFAVGQDTPIDVLNLDTLPTGISLDDWTAIEAFDIWNISGDGRKVMINLGHAAILVEIDYGQE
jgi:hypothetical protein